ncbi:hypothetical protein LTR15_011994 [Elasticomyces elasticus]|nr:hypothetical protein LTR15_011994 [Elasticomyces elasticus]
MARPNTIAPKDNSDEHEEELHRVLDRVLSHRDAMRDSASRPMLDRTIQSRRRARSHTTMERLKELLVDLDSLQHLREQGRKRLVDAVKTVPTTNCASEAISAVFPFPELLEAILLHLPMSDLFRSEDTCRTFRDTIAASLALRQRLFRESNVNMRYRTPGYLGPCDLDRRQHGYQIHLANGVEGSHASRNRSNLSCFIARFNTVGGTPPELRDRVMDMFLHDWNGDIDNTITFRGYFKQSDSAAARDVVERYESDPAWRPHIEYAAKCQEMDARLDAYIAGKLSAQENGEIMPTFEEFEARSGGQTPDL